MPNNILDSSGKVRACKGIDHQSRYCSRDQMGVCSAAGQQGSVALPGPRLSCTPGYFSMGTNSSLGASSFFADRCSVCPVGRFSSSAASSCTVCSIGHECPGGPISPGLGAEQGAAAANTDGLSSRRLCRNGTFSNHRRTVLDAAGARAIRTLAAFADSSHTPAALPTLGACANCSAGMFSGRGAASCQNCTAGRYSTRGAASCAMCTPGYYCPGGTEQIRCQTGFFSVTGQSKCEGCPAGTYVSVGATVCGDCDRGYFCLGAMDKMTCPAGTWMNGTGSTTRSDCLECRVPPACLPGGECERGHKGEFCLECWTRKTAENTDNEPWYKGNDDLCYPCPTNTTLLMGIAAGGFFIFALIMLRLGSAGRKPSAQTAGIERTPQIPLGMKVTVPFSILFTELQITMRFYELNLRWPQFVLDFIAMLGSVLEMDFVNLAMTDPSCAMEFDTPGEGYTFRQNLVLLALPVFCLAIAVLHLLMSCAVSTLAVSGGRLRAYLYLIRSVPLEVANACVTAFSTMYIMLISSAIEAWHCTSRLSEDGETLHMDKIPEVLCDFDEIAPTGSYFRIWIRGLALFVVYGFGLPLLMWYILWSRNKRYVPLDKENYVEPMNPCVRCCRSCCQMGKKGFIKVLLAPVYLCMHIFQDKESARLVREEEARMAEAEREALEELGLDTRLQGGGVAEDAIEPQLIGGVSLTQSVRAGCRKLRVTARSGQIIPVTAAADDAARPTPTSVKMQLIERLRGGGGGKKEKKKTMRAKREAEANWRTADQKEEEAGNDVVEKKAVVASLRSKSGSKKGNRGKHAVTASVRLRQGGASKKSVAAQGQPVKTDKGKQAHASSGTDGNAKVLGGRSLKSVSFNEETRRLTGLQSGSSRSPLRAKSSRKLRADSERISSSSDGSSRKLPASQSLKLFSQQHHPKVKRKGLNGSSKGSFTADTWKSLPDEGPTQDPAQLADAKAKVKARTKAAMKSGGSFQKRMSKLRAELPHGQGPITAKGEELGAGTDSVSFKERRRTAARRQAPKTAAYAIDEDDTDGYIYWHEGTRKMLGWIFLRFRPQRWYWEFIFMARKAIIITVTIWLGKVGDGWIAWFVISTTTLLAIALQTVLIPFPEDPEQQGRVLCECECAEDNPLVSRDGPCKCVPPPPRTTDLHRVVLSIALFCCSVFRLLAHLE
eukprot:COSAG01_NODE_310_length_19129_cov_22.110615_5_plen_1172_part_00